MTLDAILGLVIYTLQPALPGNSYQSIASGVQIENCIDLSQAQSLMEQPQGRIVARADFFWTDDLSFGGNVLTVGKIFYVRVRNPRLNGQALRYTTLEGIEAYLEKNPFERVDIYEEDSLNQMHDKPSAIAIKDGANAHVLLDFKGEGLLADGMVESGLCIGKVDIAGIIRRILRERIMHYSNSGQPGQR